MFYLIAITLVYGPLRGQTFVTISPPERPMTPSGSNSLNTKGLNHINKNHPLTLKSLHKINGFKKSRKFLADNSAFELKMYGETNLLFLISLQS